MAGPSASPTSTRPRRTSASTSGPSRERGSWRNPRPADKTDGKSVFTANCGGCHTLADAGTSGTVGPNLDAAKPPKELVVDRVTNGKGVMPPFKDSLDAAQIQAVADYVASTAGR